MRVGFLILLTCLAGALIAQGDAEDGTSNDEELDDATTGTAYLSEYSDPHGIIGEVKARIARKRYREGIELLHLLLKKAVEEGKEDELILRSENVYVPVHEFCRSVLKDLPEDGLKTYLSLYSAEARRELEKALPGGMNAVLKVAKAYPATPASKKALQLMADSALEKADGTTALMFLREAGATEAMGTMKFAAALMMQGARSEAGALLESVGKAVLCDADRAVLERLKKELGAASTRGARKEQTRDSFYGGVSKEEADRDFAAVSHYDYKGKYGLAWRAAPKGVDKLQPRRRWGPAGMFTINMNNLHLLAAGKVVYMVDGKRIQAMMLSGGRLLWRYPEADNAPQNPYGVHVACADGNAVYAVVGHSGNIIRPKPRRGPFVRMMEQLRPNDLVALKRGVRGRPKLLWSAQKRNPELKSAIFLTPPLVTANFVYCGGADASGETFATYCVFAFDKTGRLLWRRAVCMLKYISPNAGALAADAGEIFYLTNVGVLASVNAYTGSLNWVVKYGIRPTESAEKARPGNPWGVVGMTSDTKPCNPPLVWKGVYKGVLRRVLAILPTDSSFVHAYDLDRRRLLWREDRLGHSFMLGPYKDMLVLTGGTSFMRSGRHCIEGYHFFTGIHKLLTETDRTVTGAPAIAGDRLLLPCRQGLSIHRISATRRPGGDYFESKEEEFHKWYVDKDDKEYANLVHGNLVLAGDRIMLACSRWVVAYSLPSR